MLLEAWLSEFAVRLDEELGGEPAPAASNATAALNTTLDAAAAAAAAEAAAAAAAATAAAAAAVHYNQRVLDDVELYIITKPFVGGKDFKRYMHRCGIRGGRCRPPQAASRACCLPACSGAAWGAQQPVPRGDLAHWHVACFSLLLYWKPRQPRSSFLCHRTCPGS